MPVCRLCLQESVLRNSHIVPEFLYEPLYNAKGQMMGINGQGSCGWRALQRGLREPLFCEPCEQHFNEHFEKPFKAAWVDVAPLPTPWPVDQVVWIDVDYPSFKLFHLCVLFRASVSSLPTFDQIDLGPHEENIRDLLFRNDPGPNWQYPVFGFAVLHHETKEVVPLISQGASGRLFGQRCHGMIYGGVFWWVCVGSHPNREFLQLSLRPNGRLPLGSSPWNQVSVIQAAAAALRRTD